MDQFLYAIPKLVDFFVKLDHLMIFIALCGLIILKKYNKVGLILLRTSVVSLLILIFFPLGSLLLEPLENRFNAPVQLPEKIGGIIVLGGGESIDVSAYKHSPQFNSAADRIMALPKLIKKYSSSTVILSNGAQSTLNPNRRGAHIMLRWLEETGLESSFVKVEDRSKNTWENALHSQRFRTNDSPWILVTSASHMPRAMGVFRQLKWNVIPYPTDYRVTPFSFSPHFAGNVTQLHNAVHEWIGLLFYYLTDRSDNLFPAP